MNAVMILKQQHVFFLHCPSLHTPRQTLLNNIRNINEQILSRGEDQLIQTFLYDNLDCSLSVNRLILNVTIIYNINRTIQVPYFQLIIEKKIFNHVYNPLILQLFVFNFIPSVIVALHLMTVICILVLVSFILLMSIVNVFRYK